MECQPPLIYLLGGGIKAILSIPLGQNAKEDKLIWAMTYTGTFIVKSAYYLALNLKGKREEKRRILRCKSKNESPPGS